MLRTNLASRPFYNERLVKAALVLVAIATLALTLFNVAEIVSLRSRGRALDVEVREAEARAATLRADAQQIRQALNQQDVEAVQAAASQVNALIDRRAFSWTGLFNRFETTLPPSVRIMAVQPQVDQSGRMIIAITAIGRRVEDLDAFIEALEKSGAFTSTLARSESVEEDGTLRSQIQGFYRGSAPEPPAEPAAATSPSAEATVARTGGGR